MSELSIPTPTMNPRKSFHPATALSPIHRVFQRLALLTAILLVPATVVAGTPLICHPYDIAGAASLPAGPDWHGVSRTYDRTHLTRDTLALLKSDTPIIVRMETLRRAAIYATAGMRNWDKDTYTAEDRAVALELFTRLRARTTDATGPALALAHFDAGFFIETLRHARMDLKIDGYAMLTLAAALRGSDAEMEFALALASAWPNKRSEHPDHLARARDAAQPGTLLAANLATHFGKS